MQLRRSVWIDRWLDSRSVLADQTIDSDLRVAASILVPPCSAKGTARSYDLFFETKSNFNKALMIHDYCFPLSRNVKVI